MNGRVKGMFRFFGSVIPSAYINKKADERLGRLYRIGCSLMNRFNAPKLHDDTRHERILQQCIRKRREANTMKDDVEKNELQKRKKSQYLVKSGAHVEGFPKLSLEDIEDITLGVYQITNATFYAEEHIKAEGDFKVHVHKERGNHFLVVMKSRFRTGIKHHIFVEVEGDNLLTVGRYYCTCRSGARTMGCCSHVATVIWYMGYRRHLPEPLIPRSFGSGILEIVSK